MEKINLLNSEAYNPFRVRVLLFLFFFSFTISAFAHPVTPTPKGAEDKTSESLQDSLSLKSDKVETAKIYISEGTTFYNAQEIHGNVEIVQKEKIVKAAKNKTGHQLTKALPKKQTVAKPKIEGEKYTVKVRFTPLPFESNTIFSGSGENSITVPTTNSQFRIVALAVQYQIFFYIPFQEKHNSKYIMSFANEICHWQMHIRPPPTA
ncbi:MAG: hypothetical protein K0R77_3247 [Chryseobacterium sp.]|jgi:hypothetical protein|uniref:hypothetical protein n=1 Tax=Chryseobacterium sp. TaxID=1871047 RepID=UPI002626A832|nr:hypothetical protein [Chryseobacterium sp.]MDF2553972.1 hypothetical protein [Chryseobacterium sp.]